MNYLGFAIVCMALGGQASAARPTAAQIKANEAKYLPLLGNTINCSWGNLEHRQYLGGQVYAESKWDPNARLKTAREEGVNFGQITVTAKFNNFEAFKLLDKSLKGWKWEDRFDPVRGMKALVVYDHTLFNQVKQAASEDDRLAFMFSAYNGGMGGLLKDRRLCQGTAGCDFTKWVGNVAGTSWKAKSKVAGYGSSFYDINRDYVKNIMGPFGARYEQYFNNNKPAACLE